MLFASLQPQRVARASLVWAPRAAKAGKKGRRSRTFLWKVKKAARMQGHHNRQGRLFLIP